MSRPARRTVVLVALALAIMPASRAAADDVETYLEQLGLTQLLVVHLEEQLQTVPPGERDALIARLTSLYAQLLESATDPAIREDLEQRSRRLLNAVSGEGPGGGDALRLALLRGSFRRIERIAENHRLRLAAEDDVAKARQDVGDLVTQLGQLRTRLVGRAETADRRLMRSTGAEAANLSSQASEARTLVTQATYVLAWSMYYQAWLLKQPDSAKAAQPLFAELLDLQGSDPRPEDVTVDLRGLEPVARSILGMALCKAWTSSPVTAMRWLDLLDHPQTHEATRNETPAWRLAIYLEQAQFDRAQQVWTALRDSGREIPLPWIRLLAVAALEADRADPIAPQLAREAVKALAARSELRQILWLAERYGVTSLGESGFALRYIRGVQLYQQARGAHNDDRPAADAALRSKYREAATELGAAITQPDAGEFAEAAANARWLIAWCQYFQADYATAAASFEQSVPRLSSGQAEEALWMAIVCLDALAQGNADASVALQLAALTDRFLREYPRSPHAPRLILKRALEQSAPTIALVDQLLQIASDSDAHADAQRAAAGMLYAMHRAAGAQERAALGHRFIDLAGKLLGSELKAAETGDAAAADRFLALCRQMLDVAARPETARPAAAEQALDAFQRFRTVNPAAAAPAVDEMTFHQIQTLLVQGESSRAEPLADELWTRAPDSSWARLAASAIFVHLVEQRRAARTTLASADEERRDLERVVRHGERVIGANAATLTDATEPAMLAAVDAVADACMVLWQRFNHEPSGRKALALYPQLLAARPRETRFLRATAVLSEGLGEKSVALDCWRTLAAGSAAGSEPWLEARFHVIALLAVSDPPRARDVMDQHKSMNPDYGPEPWGARFRALDDRLRAAERRGQSPAPGGPDS